MPNSTDDSGFLRQNWKLIQSLFLAALPLSAKERRNYLDQHCPAPAVRAEVERMLAHADQDPSFMSVPAWQPGGDPGRSFAAGDRVTERFRIVEFLGAGGMGEVYSAFDQELRENVALKVVSRDLVSDPRILQRLRQEILLARKIAHPNVCRVFDLGKAKEGAAETLFVTMELLDGETLDARLKRHGPLTAAEALPLIEQIAAGLGAAHQAGILHRDLKPGNVMLVRHSDGNERAAITDFGLAKAVERLDPGATLTRTGELMGTPAYMAPEVIAGTPAGVASDIYALGVLILQMRSGQTSLGTGSACLEPEWRETIARCLSPDPAARYGSTHELVRALKKRPGRKRRYLLPAVGAGIAILALFAAASRLYNRGPVFSPGVQILITPTANYTGEPKLDGVTAAFRDQLNQSAVARLWDNARTAKVLRAMGRPPNQELTPIVWREMAIRENVPLVIFSNVTRLGDAYSLRVRAEVTGRNPAHPESQREFSRQTGTPAEVFDAVRNASTWLRKIVGETPAQISVRDRLPQDTTTSSWEALAIYSRAETAKDANHASEAATLLSEALQIDPEFALAHARLGDILMSIGRRREAVVQWQAAIAGAAKRRLSLPEELRIRAMYAIDTGDLKAAEPPLLHWSQDYPEDYLPPFYLGYVYRMQLRLAESARALDRAARLQSDSYFVPASQARTALGAADFDAALRACARLRELHHAETAVKFEGFAALMRGHASDAIALFVPLSKSEDAAERSTGLLLLARAQAEAGKNADAIESLTRGVQVDSELNEQGAKAVKLLGLAFLQEENRGRARALALEALDTDASPDTCLRAGTILARLGLPQDAAKALERLDVPAGPPTFDAIRLRLQGEISLAGGHFADALRDLQAASELEPPLGPRDYLARALALAGDKERARLVYQETLAHPGSLWQNNESGLPGEQRKVQEALQNLSHTQGEQK